MENLTNQTREVKIQMTLKESFKEKINWIYSKIYFQLWMSLVSNMEEILFTIYKKALSKKEEEKMRPRNVKKQLSLLIHKLILPRIY